MKRVTTISPAISSVFTGNMTFSHLLVNNAAYECRACQHHDEVDDKEVYKSLRTFITDPIGGVPMMRNWWRMAEFDPNKMERN